MAGRDTDAAAATRPGTHSRRSPLAGRPGRPLVMGVLNLTPDSFSDGGRYSRLDQALARVDALAEAGADIIDVGGESTRPGATAVPEAEELRRVVPLIEAAAGRVPCTLSIDTSKPAVMRAAVAAGAGMINDTRALRGPGALEAAVQLGVPVCLMHMQGEPATMQDAPAYADVVAEVTAFLAARVAACQDAGLPREALLIDPGFGFGKALAHNLALLRALPSLVAVGQPVVVGLSRKALIGSLTGRAVGERLHGSVALAVYAALQGASVIRVHDVAPTVDALRVAAALMESGSP